MATAPTRHRLTKHDLRTDAFTTGVFRAREWAEQNVRTVAIAVGAVIALVVGVWALTSHFADRKLDAQRLYGEAGIEMRSGNFAVATALLQRLIDEHSGAPVAGPGCFQMGHLHFLERSFDDARVAWERYINDYGDDPLLVAAAWAGLGAIEEQANFPANAIVHYEQAIDVDPTGPQAPDYLRRLIRAAVASGDSAKALSAFDRLEKDYPAGGENTLIARQMLVEKGILDPNR